MIGDNHSDTALLVGGTRDGERAPHYHEREIFMPNINSPNINSIANIVYSFDSTERKAKIAKDYDRYIRFNPIFVDKDENEHTYFVYRHEDLTEAEAFRMIIENYSKKDG